MKLLKSIQCNKNQRPDAQVSYVPSAAAPKAPGQENKTMLSNIIYSTVSALLFDIYKEEEFDLVPALLFDCNSITFGVLWCQFLKF